MDDCTTATKDDKVCFFIKVCVFRLVDFISLYNEDSERLPVKKRAEVTFQPDVKETEITSHHEYERCESLPNVDLRQISFKDEEDNECKYDMSTQLSAKLILIMPLLC